MKKQMLVIAAALVLGGLAHAGDMTSDPNRPSLDVQNHVADNFNAQKTEADCPYRVKKGASPEQVADTAPVRATDNGLVR